MSAEEEEILEVQAKYKVFAAEVKTKFKALQTSSFSQSLEPVKSALRLTPESKADIARALVHRWIAAHAADRSLWAEIYPNASLNLDALKALVPAETPGLAPGTAIEGTSDAKLGQQIIDGLRGEYATIRIDGPGCEHVMGVHLGASGDVAFFDPNFGEYWFDRASSFASFLSWFIGGRFYKRYAGFQIRNFAEREGFEPSVGF